MGTVWFMATPRNGGEPFEYGIPLSEPIEAAKRDHEKFFSSMEIIEVCYHDA